MDNLVVTTASSSIGVKPIATCKDILKKKKKKITVPRPHMIGEYNKYMSRADLMDQNITTFRISIRGQKMVVANIHLVNRCKRK